MIAVVLLLASFALRSEKLVDVGADNATTLQELKGATAVIFDDVIVGESQSRVISVTNTGSHADMRSVPVMLRGSAYEGTDGVLSDAIGAAIHFATNKERTFTSPVRNLVQPQETKKYVVMLTWVKLNYEPDFGPSYPRYEPLVRVTELS